MTSPEADIVERLNIYAEDWRTRASSVAETTDAISEIERLRAENARLREAIARTIYEAKFSHRTWEMAPPISREETYIAADAILSLYGEATSSDGSGENRRPAKTGNMSGAAPEAEQISSATSFERVSGQEDKTPKPRARVATGPSEADRHYLGAIRFSLKQLYEEHPDDCRLRELISDEVDWIEAQLAASADTKSADWDDVRGIAPNATGDLSSEAFIRKMRDEEWPDPQATKSAGPPHDSLPSGERDPVVTQDYGPAGTAEPVAWRYRPIGGKDTEWLATTDYNKVKACETIAEIEPLYLQPVNVPPSDAAAMREKCANECERHAQATPADDTELPYDQGYQDACQRCAEIIRAIPLTGQEG